ncbi:MAG: YraN family protein [Patescibacteria group bacterium]
MNIQSAENKYELGIKGQELIEARLEKYGYFVFKRNFKRIGLEIDLIMYKFLKETNTILIHIIEVKTRKVKDMRYMSQELDLEQFGIKHKWRKVRQVMFDIPEEIKSKLNITNCKHVITFDLAVVMASRVGCLNMHTYIPNVNLML